MGRTSRCSGCKLPQSEHSFGKPGKNCSGPVQEETEESPEQDATTPQDQVALSDDLSIQDTLVSLLGAVETLTAGLDEVKADNKHLRALVEEKQETEGSSASPPPRTDGAGASAKVSQPARAVTLPELRAMANLSRKDDRRVAQLGLADTSESSSDSDREDSEMQDQVRKKDKLSTAVTQVLPWVPEVIIFLSGKAATARRNAPRKNKTSGHSSVQIHFHPIYGSNILPNRF